MQTSDAVKQRERESEHAKLKSSLEEVHLDIHAPERVFGVRRPPH